MLPLWSTLPEDGTPLPKQYMSTRNTQWLSRPTPVRYTPPPSKAVPKASTTKKPAGLSAAQKAANAAAAAAAKAAAKAAAEKASREKKQNEATKTQVDALKKMIDTTTGSPSPPLRMMAPSGAPIRKKIMIDTGSDIFLCHSTLLR